MQVFSSARLAQWENTSLSSQDPEFESPMGIHIFRPFFETLSEILVIFGVKGPKNVKIPGKTLSPENPGSKGLKISRVMAESPVYVFLGGGSKPGFLVGNRKAIRDGHCGFSPGASSCITAINFWEHTYAEFAESGTNKTVKAGLWPLLSGESPQNLSGCSLFPWKRAGARRGGGALHLCPLLETIIKCLK